MRLSPLPARRRNPAAAGTDDVNDGIQHGEATDELDRGVLRAVDELEDMSNVSDVTWATLSERLDECKRTDLIFTSGCCGALAVAINTFGVRLEQER